MEPAGSSGQGRRMRWVVPGPAVSPVQGGAGGPAPRLGTRGGDSRAQGERETPHGEEGWQ